MQFRNQESSIGSGSGKNLCKEIHSHGSLSKLTECSVLVSAIFTALKKTSSIQFFKEDVSFRLMNAEALKKWILLAFKKNETAVIGINYIFCSDKYLLKLNKEYLGHNYFTDIITFDNSKEKGTVEADIFISSERVAANAKKFKTGFRDELHRVMIHGALHLMGYDDKTTKAEKAMRQAEDYWLGKRGF